MKEQDAHADLEVIDLASLVERDEQATLVPPAERDAQSRRGPGRPRRPRWVWGLVAAVALVIVWVVVGVVVLLGVRSDVERVRLDLAGAVDLLAAGDLDAATATFRDSAAVLDGLDRRVTGPTVAPVRLAPSVRRTLDAVAELGDAGAVAARAAAEVSTAMSGEGGLGALTPRDGRIPTASIRALAPVLTAAAGEVAEAVRLAEAVPVRGVDDAVVEGRREMLEVLTPAIDTLRVGGELADVVPALFGADGTRRYLVLASNPTENRGTGGFLGAYTVMAVDDGMLSLGEVGDTQDLPVPPEGTVEWPDPSLAERWDAYGGARRFRSMNMTPDFPSAATTIERYWSAVMGTDLDGVIAVDPYAFESLLGVSGPVQVGDLGVVAPEDVVEFVSYDAYALVEDVLARKRLIGDVAAATLQGFLAGPGDVSPRAVLDALGEMLRRESLLIHSVRPEEQALLEEVGLAGEMPAGEGDLLAVVLNSGSGSKVDYFLERHVRYDVALHDDGSATGILSAGLVNTAPAEGELTYMIGPPDDQVPYEPGDNVSYVSVYCAPGCSFAEVPDSGYGDLPSEVAEELGFPVASTWVLIPSMQSRELIYSFTTPDAWVEEADGGRTYRASYVHQTSIRPVQLEVRLAVPDGFAPVDLVDGWVEEDGEVVLRTEVTSDLELTVRLAPA